VGCDIAVVPRDAWLSLQKGSLAVCESLAVLPCVVFEVGRSRKGGRGAQGGQKAVHLMGVTK